jgi:hypothetical protein
MAHQSSTFPVRRKLFADIKSEAIEQPTIYDSNVAEDPEFLQCNVKTAKNCRCSNHAKTYNEDAKMWVCGIHDNMFKASGICVICREPMDNPADRINLECRHTYHKECVCHLELASCPCCRAPIINKYAKRVFSKTKAAPLVDKVFSLRPEKQKAFFSIANTVVDILDNVNDADQIMMLKSYISTYAFGIKSLQQYNGDSVGIMEDWSVAATTAFEHIRQYDTYDGLSFNTNGINFFVETNPPQEEMVLITAADRVITTEPPYIPVQQNVGMPRDPRIPQNTQFVPVIQPGQVAQLRPAENTQQRMLDNIIPFPVVPVDIEMEWDDEMYSRPNSPVSPSLIRW